MYRLFEFISESRHHELYILSAHFTANSKACPSSPEREINDEQRTDSQSIEQLCVSTKRRCEVKGRIERFRPGSMCMEFEFFSI